MRLHCGRMFFIECAGVFFMYRKNYLYGCCVSCFGLGLITGHCLESWLLCCGGGVFLIGLGLCWMRRR